jgi:seryl-tRNA synthetase
MLWKETNKIMSNPIIIRDAVTFSKRETIEKKKNQEENIQKKSRELEEKTSQRSNVVKNFLTADFIDGKDYKRILKEIDESIVKVKTDINELKKTKFSDPKESVPLEAITNACNAIKNSIEKYDFTMKRKVVDSLYEQIVVDLDWSVTLHGRIPLQPEGIDFLHSQFSSNFPSTHHLADASFRARFC